MGELDRPGACQLNRERGVITVIRGHPAALETYTARTLPAVDGAGGEVEDYATALAAYAAAASDRALAEAGRGEQVLATLVELEQVDHVPAAFGRALGALDEALVMDSPARVSDPTAFQVALTATLSRPELSGQQIREAVDRARQDPSWNGLVHQVVIRSSQVTTGADAGSQLGRILGWGVGWVDLVRTESLFDNVWLGAMVRRGPRLVRVADALDEAADATHASRMAASARPMLVDDTLRGVPRVGGGLARAGKALGWGGVGLGYLDAHQDFGQGHLVDGSVAFAGATSSGVLLAGVGGPVTLGAAAVVATGSILYENREFVGDVMRGIGRGLGRGFHTSADVHGQVVRAGMDIGGHSFGGVRAVVDGTTNLAREAWPW